MWFSYADISDRLKNQRFRETLITEPIFAVKGICIPPISEMGPTENSTKWLHCNVLKDGQHL